jgi:hypothetical protein
MPMKTVPIRGRACSGCGVILRDDAVHYTQHIVHQPGVEPRMIRRLCGGCVADARDHAERYAPPGTPEHRRRFHARLAEVFGAR